LVQVVPNPIYGGETHQQSQPATLDLTGQQRQPQGLKSIQPGHPSDTSKVPVLARIADGRSNSLLGLVPVQRGTIHRINPISATRMRLVPTPIRNNPTSACMSHQSA
jgi:hypothetical protein